MSLKQHGHFATNGFVFPLFRQMLQNTEKSTLNLWIIVNRIKCKRFLNSKPITRRRYIHTFIYERLFLACKICLSSWHDFQYCIYVYIYRQCISLFLSHTSTWLQFGHKICNTSISLFYTLVNLFNKDHFVPCYNVRAKIILCKHSLSYNIDFQTRSPFGRTRTHLLLAINQYLQTAKIGAKKIFFIGNVNEHVDISLLTLGWWHSGSTTSTYSDIIHLKQFIFRVKT